MNPIQELALLPGELKSTMGCIDTDRRAAHRAILAFNELFTSLHHDACTARDTTFALFDDLPPNHPLIPRLRELHSLQDNLATRIRDNIGEVPPE